MKAKFKIPYAKQEISHTDILNVSRVLKSDFITQGPKILEFERKVAKFSHTKFAVAVNSASSALHISCLALDLKKGDFLWTSANTFISSATCALHCGAGIDLIDINNKDFNISIKNLKKKLLIAKKQRKLPKIIVPVSFGGLPCDLLELKELSKFYKFKILEDASHAIGSYYKGIPSGSNDFSDISVFSFHPVKIITTGEGGVALTKNKKIYEKLKMLRTHGITREKKFMENKTMEKWYYEHKYLGFNYRITDIQASLGISQLKNVRKFIKKRNQIAKFYKKKLSKLPVVMQKIGDLKKSSYHLFVIKLSLNKSRNLRDKLYNFLRKNGIFANLHYIPIYHHPYFKKFDFKINNFLNTENYYKNALSLPMYNSLKKNELNFIINKISLFFKKQEI